MDDGQGRLALVALVVTHVVWDPLLTLAGVAEFGLRHEETELVRTLIAVHPLAWLLAKVVVIGGAVAVIHRAGAHRTRPSVWLVWVLALLGFVAPLGWLGRFLAA
jgi:hypothetical protein